MIKEFLQDDKEFALTHCKMLYSNLNKPCTETCMCFGWEFEQGWNREMKDLSVKLEMLNTIFYKSHRVKIVLDQCKEKFGMLTVYYSVEIDSPFYYTMWRKPFVALSKFINKHFDFKKKLVVDEEEKIVPEYTPVEEKDIEVLKERYKNCSYVRFEKSDTGWMKVTDVTYTRRTHLEPTKHLIMYHIKNSLDTLANIFTFDKEPTTEQYLVREALDNIARELINKAEGKCYNTCEMCGDRIGTEKNKRVKTDGWISYVCEHCNSISIIKRLVSDIQYNIDKGKYSLTSDEKDIVDTAKAELEKQDYNFIDSGTFLDTADVYRVKLEEIAKKVHK